MKAVLTMRSVVAAVAMALMATAAHAQSHDPLADVLQHGAAEWGDSFDAASVGAADVRTSVPTMSPQIADAVQYAIMQYSDIVSRGGWPVVPADQVLRMGVRAPAVAVLRQRLSISGDLPQNAATNSDAFDSYVDAAVKRFQARHGIQPDGIIGKGTFAALNIPAHVRLTQLSTNLTRLKVLTQKQLPERFIMVNIPAASVEAVEMGQVVSRHTAVVGKVSRQSPIVQSRITDINFHPYWTVPASIIRKDLIPLMQKDPGYLTRYNIRILDRNGTEIPPEQVNWNSDEATRYMFKQDPGDENSLGRVKINFPSPDGVYMHDTPNKSLFNEDYRFDSSGCVRIQNIRELIVWILRDTPEWDRGAIENEFRSGNRVDVRVVNPVQLYWTYISAWSTADNVVQFREDIYNLDGLDQFAEQAPLEEGQRL